MGYEIRLIIGHEVRHPGDNIILEIARVDLCKVGYGDEIAKLNILSAEDTELKFGFFADNEDKLIREDKYGEPLRCRSLSKVIDALKKEKELAKTSKTGILYRRYAIALSLLRSIEESFVEHKEIVVLMYGH